VVKSLASAIADHDRIYAVVRVPHSSSPSSQHLHILGQVAGSAINTTGSGMPLNVPNPLAQKRCIQAAYDRAGLNPQDADFVELHATGET
jgi:acyl transferase domain-containing protein